MWPDGLADSAQIAWHVSMCFMDVPQSVSVGRGAGCTAPILVATLLITFASQASPCTGSVKPIVGPGFVTPVTPDAFVVVDEVAAKLAVEVFVEVVVEVAAEVVVEVDVEIVVEVVVEVVVVVVR
mmetsp:Transcript_50021/g.91554  ORF Transcript_50021/g.91554 Transcript_50021/m.91554 type:complete len:125 (-) Transcript_50021:339-713(-)